MPASADIVAIIDDDAFMRQALKALVASFGYAAELYESAEAFLSSAKKCEATCLLVDVQLGTGCGIELARRLAGAGFKFPIVFMTGSDDKMIEARAVETGCVAFLRKPFAAKLLKDALIKSRG